MISIAFNIKGGIGDILCGFNYVKYFWLRFKDNLYRLDIYAFRNIDVLKSIITEDFVSGVFLDNQKRKQYDLVIKLSRYPQIEMINDNIAKTSTEFIEYISLIKKFNLQYCHFFRYLPICDGLSNDLLEIENKKRIQQADIYNYFSISTDNIVNIKINDEETVLSKFGLKKNNFIIVHRGVDTVQCKKSVKLWPVQYYEELLRLVRKKSHLVIVQVGYIYDEFLSGVDLDLRGKTNFSELIALLDSAKLHIDNEGGLVHLRHFICKSKSLVLFGPTSPDVYGYSENLNLRSYVCKYPCEWVSNKWQEHCISDDKNICMHSLTPDFVFNKVEPFL